MSDRTDTEGSDGHDVKRSDRPAAVDQARVSDTDSALTTDQGVLVDDTDNTLRAGTRGPSLLADFHLREKVMRFDHERIPERVVHARGAGAHGYFRVYESLERYTSAHFLQDPDARTPVFVRFSTVQGSRGSADTVRDVRGFATKFYTDQGNFDLVGNNMPVFFIQDGIKFPDFVHALKPEPNNEMPQAASAHDTFWDFVSLQPETMHHVIWLMSDRALPRSYRTMQGFGVHTFRLINDDGEATLVKFHWSPVAGVQSLVWDEAQQIAGRDPDFNRRDLWESIESGQFPEWELGIQFIPPNLEFDMDIDLLDATKLVPEELVPVTPVGRLVLDRNPDNFFAETEQVAFDVGNVVPGIGFTDDPLMQARLFSYLDTQLTRLGGPNFAQIPINRPVAPVHNHQQDGFHQDDIHAGQANYHPNSLGGGCPAIADSGAYVHYAEHIDGIAERKRSATFADHYGQATLFWNSMSHWEREHIVAAYRFELGKVNHVRIRERVIGHLNRIDNTLARAVADGLGIDAPDPVTENPGGVSRALSQAIPPPDPRSAIAHAYVGNTAGARVAVLAATGVVQESLAHLIDTLSAQRVAVDVLAPAAGAVPGADTFRVPVPVTHALATTASVLYDAVVVADGADALTTLTADGNAVHFVAEAYKHGKPIGAIGDGIALIRRAELPGVDGTTYDAALLGDGASAVPSGAADGVAFAIGDHAGEQVAQALLAALGEHRHFGRPLHAAIA
jgi:catalase